MKLITLVRAGLLVAASDGTFATGLAILCFNSTFMRLWQGGGAVPLGREALDGGVWTMWFSSACTCAWRSGTGVFLFGAMRLEMVRRLMLSRHGVLKVASLYGPFIWLVMSLVVIPLFTKRPPSLTLRWWMQLIGHVPFVALPITGPRETRPSGRA